MGCDGLLSQVAIQYLTAPGTQGCPTSATSSAPDETLFLLRKFDSSTFAELLTQ